MPDASKCTMIVKFKDKQYIDFITDALKAGLIDGVKLEHEYVMCMESNVMHYNTVLLLDFRDSILEDLPKLVEERGGEIVYRTEFRVHVGKRKPKKERLS